MILSAQSIRKRCGASNPMRALEANYQRPIAFGIQLIEPFHERTVFNGMSFGLSCHGYDIRIAESVRLTKGGFTLASTIEEFRMPLDLSGVVHDKSTWARMGLAVQNTVLEAGWNGHLTLELSFHGSDPLYIPAGSPIAQIQFHLLDEPTEQPYSGKYQDQAAGPQRALLE